MAAAGVARPNRPGLQMWRASPTKPRAVSRRGMGGRPGWLLISQPDHRRRVAVHEYCSWYYYTGAPYPCLVYVRNQCGQDAGRDRGAGPLAARWSGAGRRPGRNRQRALLRRKEPSRQGEQGTRRCSAHTGSGRNGACRWRRVAGALPLSQNQEPEGKKDRKGSGSAGKTK